MTENKFYHFVALNCFYFVPVVTQEGKVYACGEATNGRLGLGITGGTVQVPRQLNALSQYVIKKIAVHSGKYMCTLRYPKNQTVSSELFKEYKVIIQFLK